MDELMAGVRMHYKNFFALITLGSTSQKIAYGSERQDSRTLAEQPIPIRSG